MSLISREFLTLHFQPLHYIHDYGHARSTATTHQEKYNNECIHFKK